MSIDIMTAVVVTQAVAANLRELSRRIGREGPIGARIERGELTGMFTAKLSATGNLPATHWISSGLIKPAYLNAMTSPTRLFNIGKKAWEDDGDVFPFSQAQVSNALGNCTVSDGTFNGTPEDPHQLLARLGLKLVSEPLA